ncbi:MAG: PspC domain-containing protein [Bacteroidota bacterium]
MNKVFNINLGGYPFTIDEDAYEHLNNYLDTIHKHFRSSEGYEEITGDIEARIAELFEAHLSGRKIVTIKDVNAAIRRMGTPEEFGADSAGEKFGKSKEGPGIKTGKRLFRNPDDKVVGGVCSGIAAYLGIQDPLWVRLAFVVIAISGGFGIPVYIILWAIVSEAETAGDRLAMKGEPINVSNIARTIEDEIDHLSDTLTDISNDFNSKKKGMMEEIMREVPLRKGFLW